jgi:hypothetical protein
MTESTDKRADEVGDFGNGGDSGSMTAERSDPKERATAIREAKQPVPARAQITKKSEFQVSVEDTKRKY